MRNPGGIVMPLMPGLVWAAIDNYSAIKGRDMLNKAFSGPVTQARQDVEFRLDRSGAEVRSESRYGASSASFPTNYVLDRPFLIYMKKRGAKQPYFAMWVDNAELLRAWK